MESEKINNGPSVNGGVAIGTSMHLRLRLAFEVPSLAALVLPVSLPKLIK